MQLELSKPLVFFDIEATGLSITKDRIVEISFIKLMPDNEQVRKTWRVNPEMPMPEEAFKIHGISDEELADEPTFKEIAKDIIKFIDNGDLAGFNILRYDLPLLMEEFIRADLDFEFSHRKLVDVQKIFHTLEKRNLEAAYRFYCNKELKNAHSAMADTEATHDVLIAQLDKYEQLKNNVEDLNNFLGNPAGSFVDLAGRFAKKNGEEVFNFGKHKGKPVSEVLKKEPGYYAWMMNGDFPEYTKKKLTEIRLRSMNEN